MRNLGWSAALMTAGILGLVGCPDEKETGTEGGACYANQTCNAGLVCLSSLCVDPGSWPDAGTDGDGEGDGGVQDDNDLPDAGPTETRLMLVLDRSGSMKTLETSDGVYGCASDSITGEGYDPHGNCKWNTLKRLLVAQGGFLDQTSFARHGLAVFPGPGTGDLCQTGEVTVPFAASAGGGIAQIKTALDSYFPLGGTPLAATLRGVRQAFVASAGASRGYVVLVTDGMPNCNTSLSSCAACTNGGDPASLCGEARSCLDDLALVDAVADLKSLGVDTFVVGFGSAVGNAEATRVLNAAAEAGGQAQVGQTTAFYLASSDAQLQSVLDAIRQKL